MMDQTVLDSLSEDGSDDTYYEYKNVANYSKTLGIAWQQVSVI